EGHDRMLGDRLDLRSACRVAVPKPDRRCCGGPGGEPLLDAIPQPEGAVGGPGDGDRLGCLIGDEAGKGLVVAKPALGLGEEMDGWIETARDAQEIAIDALPGP